MIDFIFLYISVFTHVAAILISLLVAWRHVKTIPRMQPFIVNNINELTTICRRLKKEAEEYNVVGLDAEWVTTGNHRNKVALLQLCTANGTCALIRLNLLKCIPKCLKTLLEDNSILKVGVSIEGDSSFLFQDYQVLVKDTLDLRHLHPTKLSLATLVKDVLGIKLEKNMKITCSNWEAPLLTSKQITYAALDAYTAVEVFKKWTKSNYGNRPNWEDVLSTIKQYTNTKFKKKSSDNYLRNSRGKIINQEKLARKGGKRLYDSVLMWAPNGALLCSTSKSKAAWYLRKGKAVFISGDPSGIQLLFEPKHIPGRNEALHEKELKKDQCVVCGFREHLLKHSIVPRCYSKLFPLHLKSHYSHDTLVLCVTCLVKFTSTSRWIQSETLKKTGIQIKEEESEAMPKCVSILYNSGAKLPENLKRQYEEEVMLAFNLTEVTRELLTDLYSRYQPKKKPNQYELVTEHFYKEDPSLHSLRKIFRQHFVDTMGPKFLPKYWSVDHQNEQ